MIFDCFLFYNEKSLLKIRAESLKHLDVTHVLIEAPFTHSGKPKPLYFKEYADEFSEYNIIPFVADDIPGFDYFQCEIYQRNTIKIALAMLGAELNDTVILSDVDEIPKAEAIESFIKFGMNFAALMMPMYRYYLNMEEKSLTWDRARIFRYKYMLDKTADQIRNSGFKDMLWDSGWHFSYQGGIDAIVTKLESFSHTEFNTPEFNNWVRIQQKIESKESLFGKYNLSVVPIDDSFPTYVQREQHASLKYLIKQP